ncbi:sensor histidine kinase [Kaarinaea lacus]
MDQKAVPNAIEAGEKPVAINKARRNVHILCWSFVGVYALVTYSGLLGDVAAQWWSDSAWTLASLAAAIKSLHTAFHQQKLNQRNAWLCYGLAALSWFIGMLIWDYHELAAGIAVPFPSLADVFFLCFAPLFVMGTMFFRLEVPNARFTLIQLGNLGIILSTIAMVVVIILYIPIVESNQPARFTGVAVAYPVFYALAFFFTLFCFWYYSWQHYHHVFGLLLGSLFLHAITVVLYSFELLGERFDAVNYINVYWLAAFALQYLAASEQDFLRLQQPGVVRKGPKTRVRRLSYVEGIMPAIALGMVLLVAALFWQKMDQNLLRVITIGLFLFTVFLALREWYTSRVQHDLVKALDSARQDLEVRVEARTQELQHANRELESFCYSVSHDLRSPLRAIDGFSYVLAEDYEALFDEDAKDYLQRIRKSSQRMGQLIDDLLHLSRIGRTRPEKQSVCLSDMVEQISTILRERNPDRIVDIWIQSDITVSGDSRLLRVALENLMDNAWKFTAKTKQAKIHFGCEQLPGEKLIYIKDNGAGFDPGFASKLFKAFTRLHKDEEFPGTGIGLATVERVIKAHGGRIWAEGRVEKGATIYFVLPDA